MRRVRAPGRRGAYELGRGGAALALMIAFTALASPDGVAAQRVPRGPGGAGPDREQLEQRIRAQMGRMMRERLGLDADQSARLSEVVQGFESQRRELLGLEQATRRRVEEVLREGSEDQEEARALLGRMSDLRVREVELFRAEQEALLEVLTPTQVLELQSLRQELGRRIRALQGGRGRSPGSGRGSFGPGPRGR